MNKSTDQGRCHAQDLQNALMEYLSGYEFIKTPTKRQRLIAWLVVASLAGCKVTRFDAEWVGCHVWNTSVSEIGRYDCIVVDRQDTKRPTRFGKDTDCKEYWLEPEQVKKAEAYLSGLTISEAA